MIDSAAKAPLAQNKPRWRALWSLALLVLLVHLWLLTGTLPGWPGSGTASAPDERLGLDISTTPETTASAGLVADEPPAPVMRSTVRWIVLRPPPPPPPPPAPEPVRQAPAPRPADTEAEPEPEPEPEILEATSETISWPQDPWTSSTELVDPMASEPQDLNLPSDELASLATERDAQDMLPAAPEARASDEQTQTAGDTPSDAVPTGTASAAVQADAAPPGGGARSAAPDLGGTASAAQVQLGPHVPPSAELRYSVNGSVKGLQYSASASLSWRHDGQRYEAKSEIRAFLLGSRSQTSVGRIGAGGIEPERFGDRRRQERAAHFDREQQRIRYSSNAADAPLLPGAQDQLTASLQLATLLRAVPAAREAGHVLRLPVTSTSYAEVWRFEVGDLTSLDLPAGTVMAHKITRGPRREFDKTIDIWLAPAHAFLPVRMRITEHNGDVVDQQLTQWPEALAVQNQP